MQENLARGLSVVSRAVSSRSTLPVLANVLLIERAGWPVSGAILFFGAINYYPNTDGLHFFLDEVFPRVRREHPNARLYIVGQLPPPTIVERAGDDVIVTGLVEDLRPYLERATVVIAPLRIGGGTRLKIVEAMAAERLEPKASTARGAVALKVLVTYTVPMTGWSRSRVSHGMCG